MRIRPRAILAAIAAVGMLAAGAPSVEGGTYESTTEAMFTNNPNTGCAERGDHVLVYDARPGSNCGYIYGAPIGQIDRDSEQGLFDNARVYATEAGTEIMLDASRAVEGVVTVSSRESFCASVVDSTVNGVAPGTVPCVPHTGTGAGLGEIKVEVKLTGVMKGQLWTTTDLGSTIVSAFVTPGAVNHELAYSFDLPAGVDGALFESLSFSVDVHGYHLGTGYANASGRTSVNIPSFTFVEAPAA